MPSLKRKRKRRTGVEDRKNDLVPPRHSLAARLCRIVRAFAASTFELWKTFPDATKLVVLTSLALGVTTVRSLKPAKVESGGPACIPSVAATPLDATALAASHSQTSPQWEKRAIPVRKSPSGRGASVARAETQLSTVRPLTRSLDGGSGLTTDEVIRRALEAGHKAQRLGHHGSAYRSLREAAERLDGKSKAKVLDQIKEAESNYQAGSSYEAARRMGRALGSVNPE